MRSLPPASVVPDLDLKTRYQTAWAEMNTRIGVRANINTVHLVSILTLLGISINSSDVRQSFFISCILPLNSFIFTTWYLQNDRVLGIMSAFCGALERMDIAKGIKLPAFHSKESGFMDAALKFRVFGDTAMAMICVASPSYSLFHFLFDPLLVHNGIVVGAMTVSLLFSLINVSVLLLNKHQRSKTYINPFDSEAGVFHYENSVQNLIFTAVIEIVRLGLYGVCGLWVLSLVAQIPGLNRIVPFH